MERALKVKGQRPEEAKVPATLPERPLDRKVEAKGNRVKVPGKALVPGRAVVKGDTFKNEKEKQA
jgi:hypothetical protein